ncbi:MAG: hypothetical protein U0S12_09055 [Fimbriimonadales bacterium]
MSHERKKGGVRKDKKTQKMREAVDLKHQLHDAAPERPTTDQWDVQTFKPGSAGDRTRHLPPPTHR